MPVAIAKLHQLVVDGFRAGARWYLMAPEGGAVFVGNVSWMAACAGMLYLPTPARLCVNYLIDDQQRTGLSPIGLALLLGGLALRKAPQVRPEREAVRSGLTGRCGARDFIVQTQPFGQPRSNWRGPFAIRVLHLPPVVGMPGQGLLHQHTLVGFHGLPRSGLDPDGAEWWHGLAGKDCVCCLAGGVVGSAIGNLGHEAST